MKPNLIGSLYSLHILRLWRSLLGLVTKVSQCLRTLNNLPISYTVKELIVSAGTRSRDAQIVPLQAGPTHLN